MDSNRRPAGHTALPRTEYRRKGLWVPALGSGVPSQAPVVPPRTSPVNEAGAGAGAGGEAMHGGEEDDSCHMRPHWDGARDAGGGGGRSKAWDPRQRWGAPTMILNHAGCDHGGLLLLPRLPVRREGRDRAGGEGGGGRGGGTPG